MRPDSAAWLLLAIAAAPSGRASQWTIETLHGPSPGSRWGASLTVLPGSPPRAVVCGGTNPAGDFIGGCYIFNSTSWSVSQLLSPGTFTARADHTGVVYGDLLVVYGGNVSESQPSLKTAPSVYSLSNLTHIAAPIVTGDVPPARWGHTATPLGSAPSMWVIFGGVGDESSDDLDDVAILDLGDGRTPALAWRSITVSGALPAARHYHAAAAYGADSVVVSGGTAAGGEVFADTYMLTCATASGSPPSACTWSFLQAVRGKPQFGHVAVMASTTFVVYGGSILSTAAGGQVRTLELDSSNPVWSDAAPTGAWLGTPFRASGALLDPERSAADFELLVFGGRPIDVYIVSPPLVALLQQLTPPEKPGFDALPVVIVACVVVVLLVAVGMYFVWRYSRARASSVSTTAKDGEALLPSGEAGKPSRGREPPTASEGVYAGFTAYHAAGSPLVGRRTAGPWDGGTEPDEAEDDFPTTPDGEPRDSPDLSFT